MKEFLKKHAAGTEISVHDSGHLLIALRNELRNSLHTAVPDQIIASVYQSGTSDHLAVPSDGGSSVLPSSHMH